MSKLFLVLIALFFNLVLNMIAFLSALDIRGLLFPRIVTVFKGACLFSVFLNNFVNESMLSGFSFARLEDSSIRNSTSEYLLWSL